MQFQHAAAVWHDFPALVPGVLYAEGITGDVAADTERLTATAKARLADGPEGELPEIQAWRRASTPFAPAPHPPNLVSKDGPGHGPGHRAFGERSGLARVRV